jgi:hypothetical protein
MPIFETAAGRVLFIHVPKTGGSTIEYELRQHHPISMSSNSVWPGYQSTPQHLHSGPLIELFQPGDFVYVFAVVRHPVDRICSAYNWNQRNRALKVPFWIWLRVKLHQVRNSPCLDDNHLRPQEEFLCHNAEVFRLEDGLDKVFQRLGKITGVSYSNSPEIRKQSAQRQISVSKADRHLINRVYANDFKRFGYDVKFPVARR